MVRLHLVERYDVVDELHTSPGRRRRKEGRGGVCGEREGIRGWIERGRRRGRGVWRGP